MGRSLLLWSVAHHRLREQPCGKPGLGLACAGGELAELVDDPGFDAEAVELLDDGWFGFHGGQSVVLSGPRQPRLLRARILALWRETSAGTTGRRLPRGRSRSSRCGASWCGSRWAGCTCSCRCETKASTGCFTAWPMASMWRCR